MKLILKNKNNQSLEISEYSDYLLEKVEGLGNLGINLYTSKSPNQDGESYQGNTLGSRDINIELSIVANNKEDMLRKRDNILKIVNSKLGELELIYKNGSKENIIKGILENINFPHEENFEDNVQKVLIDLYCPNPLFKDVAETRTDVSTEIGGFEFPLEIPAEGLELSIRTINYITNIYNGGSVETPIRVILRAIGTVENPIITNLDTGEFIKVKRTLSKGDVLEINTEFGNKRVEIIRDDGSRENVFNYIDYKSKFFSISSGDTKLKYGADLGDSNLDVYIYYTPLFLGV